MGIRKLSLLAAQLKQIIIISLNDTALNIK